jgi:hypothetical protein
MSETHTVIQHLIQASLDAAAAVKSVELQLAWYFEDYKVITISNTTILKPGEWLAVEAVDQINLTKGWTVRMADNDILAAVTGMAMNAGKAAIL